MKGDRASQKLLISLTRRVEVRDKRLTLVMGMYNQIGHINFLNIEAAAPLRNVYLPAVRR